MEHGSGDSKRIYGTSHPLKIDLILERCFTYLPPADLKSCRLVCRVWTTVASPILVSRTRLNFDERLPHWDATRLSDCIQSLGLPQISKLPVHSYFCFKNNRWSARFLRKFGHLIRTLNIDFWLNDSIAPGLQKCRFLSCLLKPEKLTTLELLTLPSYISQQKHLFPRNSGRKYLPHLKNLTLNCAGDFHSGFIKDLISNAPQLTQFIILFIHEEIMDWICEAILESGTRHLAHLDFQCSDECGFTASNATSLVRAGLQLETLRFHTVDIYPHIDCLKVLMKGFWNSLTKLRLYPSAGCRDLEVLPHVKELTLECPWISDVLIFMEKCPNMKSLCTTGDYYVNIRSWDDTASDTNWDLLCQALESNNGITEHKNLTSLTIQDRTYDERIFTKLFDFFPNLKKISAHVNEKVFGVFCERGQYLEEVDVTLYSMVPTAALIGAIPHAEEKSVDCLQNVERFWLKTRLRDNRGIPPVISDLAVLSPRGLGKLTKLRSMILESCQISDDAILALSNLPHLVYLDLGLVEQRRVSKECLSKLKIDCPYLQLRLVQELVSYTCRPKRMEVPWIPRA